VIVSPPAVMPKAGYSILGLMGVGVLGVLLRLLPLAL